MTVGTLYLAPWDGLAPVLAAGGYFFLRMVPVGSPWTGKQTRQLTSVVNSDVPWHQEFFRWELKVCRCDVSFCFQWRIYDLFCQIGLSIFGKVNFIYFYCRHVQDCGKPREKCVAEVDCRSPKGRLPVWNYRRASVFGYRSLSVSSTVLENVSVDKLEQALIWFGRDITRVPGISRRYATSQEGSLSDILWYTLWTARSPLQNEWGLG